MKTVADQQVLWLKTGFMGEGHVYCLLMTSWCSALCCFCEALLFMSIFWQKWVVWLLSSEEDSLRSHTWHAVRFKPILPWIRLVDVVWMCGWKMMLVDADCAHNSNNNVCTLLCAISPHSPLQSTQNNRTQPKQTSASTRTHGRTHAHRVNRTIAWRDEISKMILNPRSRHQPGCAARARLSLLLQQAVECHQVRCQCPRCGLHPYTKHAGQLSLSVIGLPTVMCLCLTWLLNGLCLCLTWLLNGVCLHLTWLLNGVCVFDLAADCQVPAFDWTVQCHENKFVGVL